MAGTATVTEVTHKFIKRIAWDWASDSTSSVTQATTGAFTGKIVAAYFDPDAGGTQPTNLYDVTITDANGFDVLAGQGANLSNSANDYKVAKENLGAVVESVLTLNVTNAGASKGGIAELYIEGS